MTAGSITILWWPAVPLGIPGEWTWSRIPLDAAFGLAAGLTIVAIVGAIYLLLAWAGSQRLPQCGRTETLAWLSGLVALAFAWLWNVQESQPAGYGMSKVAWVLYYPGPSGYYYEALHEIDDVNEFLTSYESKMEQGDVLHIGTHPPGLFLLHESLIATCRRSPGMVNFLEAIQPESVRQSLTVLERIEQQSGRFVRRSEQAALWLAALVTQFAVALTIIPLYGVLRFWSSRQTAWAAVSFWPLIPALAIFLPKSDALFPVIAASFLYLWVRAVHKQSVVVAFLSGLVGCFGLLFSLAFLPIALIAAIYGGLEFRNGKDQDSSDRRKRITVVTAAAACGFLIPIVLAAILYDLNLVRVWMWNFENHANFYDQFPRTWWKWTLVNPLELLIAVGAPLMTIAVFAIAKTKNSESQVQKRLILAGVLVWIVLWLSGKNMGEAARLWIILMPIVVLACASYFLTQFDSASNDRKRWWLILLTMQAILCTFTVLRVDGFELSRHMTASNQMESSK